MLKQRIKILLENGVISEKIANFINTVIDELVESYHHVNDKKLVMFTTHLAMALERIEKGKIVEKMDRTVFSQIKNNDKFEDCLSFYKKIFSGYSEVLPESEEEYVLLHICNMFNNNDI